MNKEQVLLDTTIVHVQGLAGSAISANALSNFPNVSEIFRKVSKSIGRNRKKVSNFEYKDLLEDLPINYNSEHISSIAKRWAKLIFNLGSSTKYDLYPYSYEEMENIHNKVFFSELESVADYIFSVNSDAGRMFVLYALIILGASVNISIFEEKAAMLLELQNVPTWLSDNKEESLKSFASKEESLLLVPYQTAALLLKTLTAAGGVAQAVESENLESGTVRLNTLTPQDPKKGKRFKNVEDELRKLLTRR